VCRRLHCRVINCEQFVAVFLKTDYLTWMEKKPMAGGQRSNSSDEHRCFLILLTTSFVSALIMLDSNVVAVSLPAIGQSLHASFAGTQWVISSYVLTYTALLLAAGSYADLCGRKKSMLWGLAIFAVASGACGLARSTLLLNLARAVQGVGGALLLTASLAIISQTFAGAARARAFSFWGASLGVALTAGPIVGGAITSYFGWRWIFLINVPASAALILSTIFLVPESHDSGAKRLDFKGIVTFCLGLVLLIWALIDGNEAGWTSGSILARLIGSLVLFVAFWYVEIHQDRPMVDFDLFHHPTFVGSVAAMIGYGASAQVMVFYLPLFLQNAYGFTPAKAGLGMIPFALPMMLAPRLTKELSKRYSGRAMLACGLAVTCVGNLLFWAVARADFAYPVFVASMLVAGIGAGLLNGETVRVLQGAVPADRAGMASGLASTTRFIGILVAVAGLGAVLSRTTAAAFSSTARAVGLGADVAKNAAAHVTSGDLNGALQLLPAALRETLEKAASQAFSEGFASASLVAALVAAIAFALTYWLVSSRETAPPSQAPTTEGRANVVAD
jgi:EmrB/QacA subfamily drug resistance transporter